MDCLTDNKTPTFYAKIHTQPPKPTKTLKFPQQTETFPPNRSWTQCVESTLLNDQVRRPMAKCDHSRPLPPVVISIDKLAQLKAKATEKEREREMKMRELENRECARLRARERMGKWGTTTESLLSLKYARETAKIQKEEEEARKLLADVAFENDEKSKEQVARAKKLMLLRKGNVKDFHAAMAYSKMLQEIEAAKESKNVCGDEDYPLISKRCFRAMIAKASRVEREKAPAQAAEKISDGLLCRLQKINQRTWEQNSEISSELTKMQQLIQENMEPIPPKIPEKKKNQIYQDEISDHLAIDAYIESHENEIDRQACEFVNYKNDTEAIRKSQEKQLIDEKVAYNIQKSEAAAKALELMRKRQQESTGNYDALKEQWAIEHTKKLLEKNAQRKNILEKVKQDFCKRQETNCDLHPARQWAKEQLVACENYEKECELKSDKRLKNEEVAKFNRDQAEAKRVAFHEKRKLEDLIDLKSKCEYEKELQEMKDYAEGCCMEWKCKGRNTFAMEKVMKKWDYDGGMVPMLSNYEGPSGETTSKRLGFGSGGC